MKEVNDITNADALLMIHLKHSFVIACIFLVVLCNTSRLAT